MTTAPPTTLAAWLNARLDEDYEIAYGAAPSPWKEGGGWDGTMSGARSVLDRHGEPTADCYYGGTYGHVLHFDPTRVLADIEAKRRVVELHAPRESKSEDGTMVCSSCGDQGCCGHGETPPCNTLRTLALSYRDHPEWSADWLPRTWNPMKQAYDPTA